MFTYTLNKSNLKIPSFGDAPEKFSSLLHRVKNSQFPIHNVFKIFQYQPILHLFDTDYFEHGCTVSWWMILRLAVWYITKSQQFMIHSSSTDFVNSKSWNTICGPLSVFVIRNRGTSVIIILWKRRHRVIVLNDHVSG